MIRRAWAYLVPAERVLAVTATLVLATLVAVVSGHDLGSVTVWWLALLVTSLLVCHFHLANSASKGK